MKCRVLALASVSALVAAPVWAAPDWEVGTVRFKDSGSEYPNCEYRIEGNRVTVKTPYFTVTKDLGDVVIIPGGTSDGDDDDDGDEPGDAGGPSAVDRKARCELIVPDGWRAAKSGNPLERIRIRDRRRDAFLAVSVRPADADWDLPDPRAERRARLERPVIEHIQEDLSSSWADVSRSQPEVDVLFGSPVVRVDYEAAEFYDKTDRSAKTQRVFHEVRFRRLGLEYAVTLSLPEDGAESFGGEVDELLRAFSFLPPVTIEEGHYTDFTLGFSIDRPEGWAMRARPFDPSAPLHLSFDGDRGELRLAVLEGDDAAGLLRQRLRSRQRESRYYSEERRETVEQDGVDVEKFSFEDYEPGGRKKQRYLGFAVAIGGRVLIFTGVHPLTDADSDRIASDLEATLRGLELFQTVALRRQLEDAARAMALVGQGFEGLEREPRDAIRALDRAISDAPDYARAFYLRGLAKREVGDFEGYREDLERAAEVDPDGGYGGGLVDSYVEEAEARSGAGEWREAVESWAKAFRNSDDPEHLDELLSACNRLSSETRREKNFDEVTEFLEDHLRPLTRDHPEAEEALADVYENAIDGLIREEEFRDAKGWLRALRRLGSDYRSEYDKLKNDLERRQERARDR